MNANLMQQIHKVNKDGKSANPDVKIPIFVGSKAAEMTTKCAGTEKKSALRKILKKKK